MFAPAKILILSNNIYSLLLYLYPNAFRREFGREMTQVFRDDTRHTLSECGWTGLVRLWLIIVIDLNKSVLAEHLSELLHRPQHPYVRWSGVPATVGGIVWLTPWFLQRAGWEISVSSQLLMSLFGLILVALGLTGLHLRLRASGSRLSAVAYGLSLLGGVVVLCPVVFVLLTQQETDGAALGVVIAGVICMVLGLMIMGVITLSRRALGPLSFVPLALALGYFILVGSMQLSQTVPSMGSLIPIFMILDMVSWLLLGAALLFRSQQMTKAPG
jgi:hypothetical protein